MSDAIKEVPNSAPLSVEELNARIAKQVLPTEKPTGEELTKLRAKKVSMLDRGMLNYNLKVDIPDHLHLEWGPNDPSYIRDMEEKGFIIDTKYSSEQMRTTPGRIPDVIPFITQKWNKELQDEVVHERAQLKHGYRGEAKEGKIVQAEEKEVLGQAGLPVINESRQEILDASQLTSVLDSHIAEREAERELTGE